MSILLNVSKVFRQCYKNLSFTFSYIKFIHIVTMKIKQNIIKDIAQTNILLKKELKVNCLLLFNFMHFLYQPQRQKLLYYPFFSRRKMCDASFTEFCLADGLWLHSYQLSVVVYHLYVCVCLLNFWLNLWLIYWKSHVI